MNAYSRGLRLFLAGFSRWLIDCKATEWLTAIVGIGALIISVRSLAISQQTAHDQAKESKFQADQARFELEKARWQAEKATGGSNQAEARPKELEIPSDPTPQPSLQYPLKQTQSYPVISRQRCYYGYGQYEVDSLIYGYLKSIGAIW